MGRTPVPSQYRSKHYGNDESLCQGSELRARLQSKREGSLAIGLSPMPTHCCDSMSADLLILLRRGRGKHRRAAAVP